MPQDDLSYLLLPGSDGSPATWSHVAELLRARGDLVETPDGWDRRGLVAQAEAVADTLVTRSVRTLVTWSYSGLVGSLAVRAWDPPGVLVHIDPLLPGGLGRNGELWPDLPPVVRRLIGPDVEAATTPVVPACRSVVVACALRPAKPAFTAVERSVDWAVRAGLQVRWIASGHMPMRDAPDALAQLLDDVRPVAA